MKKSQISGDQGALKGKTYLQTLEHSIQRYSRNSKENIYDKVSFYQIVELFFSSK